MEFLITVLVVVVGLSLLGVGYDSRPGIGDDWHRSY
jgi:hypothetical protein